MDDAAPLGAACSHEPLSNIDAIATQTHLSKASSITGHRNAGV
jgi:hypothetical protein